MIRGALDLTSKTAARSMTPLDKVGLLAHGPRVLHDLRLLAWRTDLSWDSALFAHTPHCFVVCTAVREAVRRQTRTPGHQVITAGSCPKRYSNLKGKDGGGITQSVCLHALAGVHAVK